MKYITNTTDFYIEEPTVMSLGKFDGIHRGHELLMEHLAQKKEEGLYAAVFTFNIPPRQGIRQEEAKVLTTNEEKKHIFEQIGVDYLIECPFTKEIRMLCAEDFIEMMVKKLHVRCFVVGEDFHFGHERRGDYKMLQKYAAVYGYEVLVIEKIKEEERDISSTYVREEIAAGNIEMANRLLGYRYFVTGEIVHGNHIGAAKLGIPTINQLPAEEKLLPPYGVYVTEVQIGEERYRGITNVGCKPTIEGKNPIGVETHLIDFAGDVYGKIVTVEFLTRVREEKKFASIEELKEQMLKDVAYGRNYFNQTV